jgi:hypothetical protein
MVFDHLDEAFEVYNKYACKLGFGMHIGNTKYITTRNAPKGTILSRSFECVHSGKPLDEAKMGAGRTNLLQRNRIP